MKFLVVVIALLAASFYGVRHALNSPEFYEYVFSKPELSPKFCYYYGMALEQSGRARRAEVFYEIVVSTYPKHHLAPGALVKIADIKNQEFRRAEALELYRRFVADYPDDPRAPRVNKNIEIILSR
ncbi:MAG: tetratricopeptide repeat protein [Endomicrobiia bacterium]|nr:tetratricopeptide repeat protein [Endomicrobiia bacterium]